MRMPDFARIIWHSADARAVWGPRLSEVSQAWVGIERWSVVEGVRAACLTSVEPEALPEQSAWAAAHGLILLPLVRTGSASYSATPKSVRANEPWNYRCVLTRVEHLPRWTAAWAVSDNGTIGQLLGYPRCCVEAFEREWVQGGSIDTTWATADGQSDVSGPLEANILLRWVGVRAVPHLPCSFACEASAAMGRKLLAVGRKYGAAEQVEWLEEMLQWPVEWSALHGIAEIRTPILTVSARTDHTPTKRTVRREGTRYPDEGARGLRFPFRIVKDKATGSPSFKRSALPAWKLNGFGSAHAMETAHSTLLATLAETKPGSLLDLGCGTGKFLERAKALGWTVAGLENDSVRAGAAQVPVRRGNLFDLTVWDGEWDVVLVMPGRLLEGIPDTMTRAVADQFRAALMKRARTVLLYAYGDWLEKFGGLGPLAAEVGLGRAEVLKAASAAGVEAALVQFEHSLVPTGSP